MSYPVSPLISRVEFPPIAEAMSWVRQGPRNRDLINLCQAVPSYPPAQALQDEIGRIAHLPHTGGYTDIYGIPALRQAFAAHLSKDYAATLEAGHVAITTGCNQAFAASTTPDDKFFSGQLALNLGNLGSDKAMQRRGPPK